LSKLVKIFFESSELNWFWLLSEFEEDDDEECGVLFFFLVGHSRTAFGLYSFISLKDSGVFYFIYFFILRIIKK
jgi:hypothetical protein